MQILTNLKTNKSSNSLAKHIFSVHKSSANINDFNGYLTKSKSIFVKLIIDKGFSKLLLVCYLPTWSTTDCESYLSTQHSLSTQLGTKCDSFVHL